jgi:hypothetical protein
MILTATNAISHNTWSRSLAEARAEDARFTTTTSVWTLVHIALTLFGIGSVCFGRDVVAILTNDRLTQAAVMIPWLVNLSLIGLSGRIQNALVYARGAARAASRVKAILSLTTLASLPFFMNNSFGMGGGLPGLIAVILLEALLFRVYLRWKAREFSKVIPFHDWWVIAGLLTISILWAANWRYDWSLTMRALVFCVAAAAIVVIERHRLVSMWRLI